MNKTIKYTIKYVENIKDGFGGKCYFPFLPKFFTCKIEILEKYRFDIGLLNHEIKHAEQYSNNFFNSLLYELNDSYRYKCELEAYTEQIKEYKYTNISQAEWIINALFNKYKLNKIKYNIEKIKKDISSIIEGNK